MQRIILYTIAVLLLLPACSVERKAAHPQLNIPDRLVADLQHDSICIADLSWMELLGDTVLSSLIEKTLQYNKDINIASARILEYEKRHRMARSSQFPAIGIESYSEREATNYNGNSPTDDIELSATVALAWEIDFFGRLRWAKREASYNYLQTIEVRRALQMSLIAEVATAYFELVALDKELMIVENTLSTRRENVHQAKLRFEGGLTSEIPYQQARVELARTASMVPDLKLKIRMKENEISFLSGCYPSHIERASTQPSIKENILHIGLPSDLVRRRPDIQEAEMAYYAAMANAGIQWANRFPRFTINLETGFENTSYNGFFSSPFTYMIGNLAAPVFAFGKRKAQYEASLAACQAKCYAYEERVLQAFREVSDAVEAYIAAVENTKLMDHLKTSSQKYVDLALFQHVNGHINYLDVLDAQRSYFNAEIEHSNAIRDQYLALIKLYKALGGGWK